MSASALVLQLVRAHVAGNDVAFASAAGALARSAKSPAIRNAIADLIKQGRTGGSSSGSFRPVSKAATNSKLQELEPVSFEDLVLDPALQSMLDEIVVELEYAEELAARKLRARNRLLLHGPCGNGKSSVASAMAQSIGLRAYAVNMPQLIGMYMGETGKNLGAIFDSVGSGCVVVFDEIDAIGSRRGSVDSAAGKEGNSVVNTMLTLMDRNRSGVIVATTNRPDIVDPALLRRFDEQIYFPAPTPAQMRNLVEKLCAGYGIKPDVDISDCENFDAVAKRCETTARRIVMREILAAEAEEPEENGTQEELSN